MARRKNDLNRQDRSRLQSHKHRKEKVREQRLLFILACEGEKTERYYFESWFARLRESQQLSARSCVIAPHGHTNPTGVLTDLLTYQDNGMSFKDFEQRWIVIDRDAERPGGGGHTLEDFNAALQQATTCKPTVSIAWSNPCFEIWYLLHFRFQNSGTDRDLIKAQLSKELGFPYEKNAPHLYDLTNGKLEDALRNAKRLHHNFLSQKATADQANPCTTVYQLVEELKSIEHNG